MTNIKVVFLGESDVGKTSLINRYISDKFNEKIMSTMISTYATKSINYQDKEYSFNIWDTAGRQNYRSLNKILLKEVNIIVLVYDITNKQSFLELQYWLDLILEDHPDAYLILVGNKDDLFIERKIKKSDGEKFANVIHSAFTETSAKDSHNWKAFLDNVFNNYLKMSVDSKNDKNFDDDLDDDKDILHGITYI